MPPGWSTPTCSAVSSGRRWWPGTSWSTRAATPPPASVALCASRAATTWSPTATWSTSASRGNGAVLGPAPRSLLGQLLHAFGQPVHAQLAGGGRRPLRLQRRIGRRLDVDRPQRRDLAEAAQLGGLVAQGGADAGAQGTGHLLRHLDRALERPVLVQQLARGLRAGALGARPPVRRIPAQGDEVGHLFRPDAVTLAHLRFVDLLRPPPLARLDEQHLHAVPDALVHVAVTGEDERLAAGVDLGLGVGAEQVVGLDGLVAGDRPAEHLVEVVRAIPLPDEAIGHGRAVGVVA